MGRLGLAGPGEHYEAGKERSVEAILRGAAICPACPEGEGTYPCPGAAGDCRV